LLRADKTNCATDDLQSSEQKSISAGSADILSAGVRNTLPAYASYEAALFALRAQADRDVRAPLMSLSIVKCP
jgi:hypothetical protein